MHTAAVLLIILIVWVLAVRCTPKGNHFFRLAQFDYAHRGLHCKNAGIPENSMTAFYCAVQGGYGAELDVHMAKDGTLVVMHDENLQRMTGVNRRLCSLTWPQLQQIPLWLSGESIPQLQQVCALFAGRTPLIIELKTCRGNGRKLARAVCGLLDCFPNLEYCLESFDPWVLIWLRRHRPDILRGQLASNFLKVKGFWQRTGAFLSSFLVTNWLTRPNFVACQYCRRHNPSLWFCRKFWKSQEFNWTIHTPRELAQVRKRGSIAIFEQILP